MVDACNLAIELFVAVIKSIEPSSPMMFLFGVAIVVTMFNMILKFTGRKKKGG